VSRIQRLVTAPLALLALWLAARARDAGRWRDAVRLYPVYLAFRPDSARIWVQLGNVQKDTGDPGSAEHSYLKAIALDPSLADAHRQLGHALLALGRHAEARAAFEAAERCATPAAPSARRGLAAMWEEGRRLAGRRARAARAFAEESRYGPWREAGLARLPERVRGDRGSGVLADLTDLLDHLEATGRVTGIQRVQLCLAERFLRGPAHGDDLHFVFLSAGLLWRIPPNALLPLVDQCLTGRPDAEAARRSVAAARDEARLLEPEGACAFLLTGNFTAPGTEAAVLERMKAAGLRVVVLVHDLMPLTHPHLCDRQFAAHSREGIARAAPRWDVALTNSEYTARELRDWAQRLGCLDLPVHPVPLAHGMPMAAAEGDPWPEDLADLRGRPFVLSVGTIEGRKNHLALFQAWQILQREMAEVPPLVLVGRSGWLVEDLMRQLSATGNLGGLLRLAPDVSDPALDALYRACRFTIFPSFAEGWGLPVGESLALGKLCLATTEGAVPEVGQGFAEPIDPFDARGIAAKVRHFLEDDAALAAAEARIREGFRPRSWDDVARDFRAALREVPD
jgi:glycosyltransferase involved in cell wall biosynthesis